MISKVFQAEGFCEHRTVIFSASPIYPTCFVVCVCFLMGAHCKTNKENKNIKSEE